MSRITSRQNPLRILLIEDSRGDAILIEKALQHALPEAFTLTCTSTLLNALKSLDMATFDVALLDRSLPDTEAFSGLRNLQTRAPDLPIIYLTAYRDEEVALAAIEQGAQDYLYKDSIDGHIIQRAIQYAILRKQFEGVLITRANFDPLTGLANRSLFESRLEMMLARMKRQSSKLAVLFADLDRFKQVNDSFGHATGDQLLKEVGRILGKTLRPYDTAARFGGDEFAILLEHLPQETDAEIIAQKIIRCLEHPFIIDGNTVTVGVSIGIATCDSERLFSAEELLKGADYAMYQAKQRRGNCYVRMQEFTDVSRTQVAG